MTIKLRRFTFKSRFNRSNRVPHQRSNEYLTARLRAFRAHQPSAPLRVALCAVQWMRADRLRHEKRVQYRAVCFLTGRQRGTVRRFAVARTRIRSLSDQGRLLGLRKSSW